MGDRNLTTFPDSKFSNTTEGGKKKKYPPPTQKPIELVTSSFTALDVGSLAGEMYADSGLLMRENVLYNLYDPTTVEPDKEMVFEDNNKESIEEFDYKSLSIEEKRLLLERLMKAEAQGFSPVKEEEPESESVASSVESESPPRKRGKKFKRSSKSLSKQRSKSPSRKFKRKSPEYNNKNKEKYEDKNKKKNRDKNKSSSSPDWRTHKKKFRERSPVWR